MSLMTDPVHHVRVLARMCRLCAANVCRDRGAVIASLVLPTVMFIGNNLEDLGAVVSRDVLREAVAVYLSYLVIAAVPSFITLRLMMLRDEGTLARYVQVAGSMRVVLLANAIVGLTLILMESLFFVIVAQLMAGTIDAVALVMCLCVVPYAIPLILLQNVVLRLRVSSGTASALMTFLVFALTSLSSFVAPEPLATILAVMNPVRFLHDALSLTWNHGDAAMICRIVVTALAYGICGAASLRDS